jgi:hypothetical protein
MHAARAMKRAPRCLYGTAMICARTLARLDA